MGFETRSVGFLGERCDDSSFILLRLEKTLVAPNLRLPLTVFFLVSMTGIKTSFRKTLLFALRQVPMGKAKHPPRPRCRKMTSLYLEKTQQPINNVP